MLKSERMFTLIDTMIILLWMVSMAWVSSRIIGLLYIDVNKTSSCVENGSGTVSSNRVKD